MTIAQAHKELSAALQDVIEVNGGVIPDGVRFSKDQRGALLDRAVYSTLSGILLQVLQLPNSERAEALLRLFPTFIRYKEITVSSYNADEHVVYDLPNDFTVTESNPPIAVINAEYNFTDGKEKLAIVPSSEYTGVTSRRFRNTHYSDTLCTYGSVVSGQGKFTIYNSLNVDTGNAPTTIILQILPYPASFRTAAYNANVDFEMMYWGSVIGKATLYGLYDSGDVPEVTLGQSLQQIIGKF